MIVVDSSAWISFFRQDDRRGTHQIRTIGDTTKILVGDLILLEVLQGARSDRQAIQIENYLKEFKIVPMLEPGLAVRAAANFRKLRGYGVTIRKVVDTIIATYCIENDHALLHQDRDFAPFAEHLGLRIYG